MKPNKHILSLLSAIAGLVVPATAQEQAPPPAASNSIPLSEIIDHLTNDGNVRQMLESVDLGKLMNDENIVRIMAAASAAPAAPAQETADKPARRRDKEARHMRMFLVEPPQPGQADGKSDKQKAMKLRAPGTDQGAGAQTREWHIGLACDPVDDMIREHLDLPKGAGVIVTRIVDGSPAAKSGIKQNDIVVSANKQQIGNLEALAEAVQKAGRDGKPLVLDTVHKGRPGHVTVQPQGPPQRPNQAGAKPGPTLRPMDRPMVQQAQQARQIRQLADTVAKQQRAIDQLNKQVRKLLKKDGKADTAPADAQ